MAYQLKIEKVIERSVSDVFRSLSEGRLFMNCSADSNMSKFDFRVGGKYLLEFQNVKKSNHGEFLEIVPNKKIVFTWCQTFGGSPDTRVSIELFSDGPKTKLVLEHTGFANKEVCDAHNVGWTNGIHDLSEEMKNGRIRMYRTFASPVEKLYETCKNPESFFALMGDLSKGSVDFKVGGKYHVPGNKSEVKGEFLEIVPNHKISFTWLGGCGGPFPKSHVTLNLKPTEKGSAMELIHEGLTDDAALQKHRNGWDSIAFKMSETLGVIPKV